MQAGGLGYPLPQTTTTQDVIYMIKFIPEFSAWHCGSSRGKDSQG
jgi:hypothetical protein